MLAFISFYCLVIFQRVWLFMRRRLVMRVCCCDLQYGGCCFRFSSRQLRLSVVGTVKNEFGAGLSATTDAAYFNVAPAFQHCWCNCELTSDLHQLVVCFCAVFWKWFMADVVISRICSLDGLVTCSGLMKMCTHYHVDCGSS